jgi:hypothetical protein
MSDKTYNRTINIFINGKEVENSLKSIEKEYYKLRNEVAGLVKGSAEYNEKVAELQRIRSILTDHKTAINGTKGAWDKAKDGITGFMTKAAGIAGVAYGAWKGIKTIIDSSNRLTDGWEKLIGGAKELFTEFKISLANIDFTNFIEGLTEAWRRGRMLAEELQQLNDVRAYQDYKISALNRESRALQEIIKNRDLDVKTKEDAAIKRELIEKQIYDRSVLIAQRTFNYEKTMWEGRNKMAAEEAVKLYETISELDPEIRKKLEQGWAYFMGIEGSPSKAAERLRGINPDGPGVGAFTGLTSDAIKQFADYMEILESGEKEVLPKLFLAFKNIEIATAEAQERFNSVIKERSSITAQIKNTDGESKDDFDIMGLYKLNRKSFEKTVKDLRKNIDDAYKKLRPTWMENTIKDAEFRAKVDQDVNDKIIKQREDLMEKEKEQTAKKLDLYMNFASDIGAVLGQSVADGEMTAKDAAKQLVLIAIDALRQYAKIAIAQSTMASLAQPDSVATFGTTGIWRAAILTALIEAALSGVETIIKKGLYTGGFTGWGGMYEPAGSVGGSIVHGQEWVANRNMVTSPVYGPMIQALEQVQRGGLAVGGYAGSLPGQEVKGLTDPSLAPAINRLNRFLDKLDRNGVTMSFGMREANGVRKSMNKLLDLESNVSL